MYRGSVERRQTNLSVAVLVVCPMTTQLVYIYCSIYHMMVNNNS